MRDAETQVDYGDDDAVAVAPSLRWQITPDTALTLLGTYQRNDTDPLIQFASIYGTLFEGPEGYLDESLFVGEPGFDRFESEQRSISAFFEHRFNDVWSVEANARLLSGEADYRHAWWAFDDYPTRYNADGTIDRTVYRAENELDSFTLDARATAEYTLGDVEMRTLFGAGYLRAEYDSDCGYGAAGPIDPYEPDYAGVAGPIDVTDFPTSTTEEWTIHVQNRATFGGRLSVDAGLAWGRIETGETTGTFSDATVDTSDEEVTANLAVIYNFDNGFAPYVSYAESFRQEALGADAEGNTFDPTRGEQVEIGLKYQPVGTDMLFAVAAFDLTKSNLLVADLGNPGFQEQTGEASVQGIELEARTGWRDFTFDASMTFLDHENADGFRLATVSEEYGSAWIGYGPAAWNGVRVGLGARYSGAKWDGTDTQKTPSYTLYDAMVGYSTDRYDVTLTVRNLEDERHMTFCGVSECYFGEGRTAIRAATAKF